MQKKHIIMKTYKTRAILLILLTICFYLMDNHYFNILFGSYLFNTIKAFLWIILSFIILLFPKVQSKSKNRYRKMLNSWAFIFAFIFITFLVLAGIFIDGLGKSPYNHSFKGIIFNIFMVGSVLIGRELTRNYLVNVFAKKENYCVFILIAGFMTLTSFPLNNFFNIEGYKEIVKFLAQYVAPEFSKNILVTYFAFLGGPIPAIIYIGVLEGFHWLSPVLPNLKWITTAFIGILCPVFSLTIMQNIYLKEAKLFKRKNNENNIFSLIVTSLISIFIIWFSVGVFPIYPSVVITGSMEPLIKPGDIIIVEKITSMEEINNLKKNDIVQFKSNNVVISHRIIKIIEKEETYNFRTKGDNNSGVDVDLVKPKQIKGKVINVVPKIGWPTLFIKSEKDIPLDKIEF